MSTRQIAATLAAAVLLTAVLPPLFASAVNRRRIQLAADDASRLAERFGPVLTEAHVASGVEVLCGSGRVPAAATDEAQRWIAGVRASPLPVLGHDAPMDPWGRCYLVNAANMATAGGAVWVLSAGPNGVIDTRFVTRAGQPLAGDDIGALVR